MKINVVEWAEWAKLEIFDYIIWADFISFKWWSPRCMGIRSIREEFRYMWE